MNLTIAERPTKTELKVPGVKWRQHEITLVTAIVAIMVGGYILNVPNLPNAEISKSFMLAGVTFNLYRNMIVPDLGIGLLAYLAYLWLNLYMIPRLFFPKKIAAGRTEVSVSFSGASFLRLIRQAGVRYAWVAAQIISLIVVLGAAFDAATYFRHEWQFHYPGFSIFFDKNNPRSQINLAVGFIAAACLIFLIGTYGYSREILIRAIENSKQRTYNTLISNRVTSFIVQVVCIPVFLSSFRIIDDRQFFISYSLIVPAFFAMFISNVYWLFPSLGERSLLSRWALSRLVSTSFVYGMPLTVFVHENLAVAFIYAWAVQLFIVTPITWWYFQSNKDKILQLRTITKELVKSQAHLQFLRSQINPHFLFNVLNTLYGTALQENASRTAEGIQRLGDMMRFMLHENNQEFIQMEKEIEYLKNYISLQKLRTELLKDVSIEDFITVQPCAHQIAPMLFIPLVENAFKHGISLQEKSWIKIDLECNHEEVRLVVRNSMHERKGTDPEKEKSGIGLKNVVERLKLIYPGKFQISANGDGREYLVNLAITPQTN